MRSSRAYLVGTENLVVELVAVAAVVVGVLLLEAEVAVQADVAVQTLHSHPLLSFGSLRVLRKHKIHQHTREKVLYFPKHLPEASFFSRTSFTRCRI